MKGSTGSPAVVTGITGFLGRHVAAALAASGTEVIGMARTRPAGLVEGEARRLCGSILDGDFLAGALASLRPALVVHLAGAVGEAAGPRGLFDLNVLGTDRLLRSLPPDALPRVIVASSSAVYGASKELPIDEDAPLRPLSAYGASKVAQEMVAAQYELLGGPRVVRARFFNVIGPGQQTSLVVSHLASRVAAAESGGDPLIPVGNLRPRRDFVDVRDVARAVVLLAAGPGADGAFNVASGRSHSIQQCCDLLTREARCAVTFKSVKGRQRAAEIDDHVGSYARLHALTGWQPEIPFEETIREALDDWRARARVP